jgi:hypothetical protein
LCLLTLLSRVYILWKLPSAPAVVIPGAGHLSTAGA